MSATYSLKDPQAGVPVKDQVATPIILTFHFHGQRMKLGVGESILPKDWNPAKRRPRATAIGAATTTKYLDRLAAKVTEIYRELRADFVTVTPDTLKAAVRRDIQTGGKKETLVQFFDRLIEEKKPTTKTGTLQVYQSAVKLLKGYAGAKDFNDITPAWFTKYQAYMENYRDKKITKGYAANYVAKNIAIIREVMTLAGKAGLHRNTAYRNDDYKKPHEDVDTIYLSMDELEAIYKAELTPAMSRIRDRFLIGCYSGLRFSDISRLTHDDIRDGMIYNRNTKTGTLVVIPLHRVITEIMARYPEGLPPSISNQKFNESIKIVCKDSGIKTPIVRTQTRGGKKITTTCEKWELVTTHTARRSAATNMKLAGIDDRAIMAITGHKTFPAFERYLRMSQEESALSIANHSYFK